MRAEENQQPLTRHFKTLGELKNAFMPFVREGGLFISTKNQFHLDDRVTVVVTLPESEQTFTFSGDVIWITPHSAQHHAGVGVQCNSDEGEAFQKAVEQLVAGTKDEGGNTETM